MKDLIYPKEKVYFTIMLVVSILIYTLLVISLVGIMYIGMGAIIFLFVQGLFIGNIKGNAIRFSDDQFPEAFAIAKDLAQKMEFDSLPDIYVMESGGVLNAFATRFLGRNFVVIYSEVLEMAYEQGEEAISFIIAHELAHIKRGHLKWRALIIPGMVVPFLGTAYSRACEYTCDRYGRFYNSEKAITGLTILAVGKKLYNRVNVDKFIEQVDNEGGFFVWLAEILSTHPHLSKRVKAIEDKALITQ